MRVDAYGRSVDKAQKAAQVFSAAAFSLHNKPPRKSYEASRFQRWTLYILCLHILSDALKKYTFALFGLCQQPRLLFLISDLQEVTA